MRCTAKGSTPVYTEIGMMSSVISPDFLVQAAGNAAKIRTAVVLTFLLAGMTLAVALVALPVFRQASERMFWLYFGLCVAGVATAARAVLISHGRSSRTGSTGDDILADLEGFLRARGHGLMNVLKQRSPQATT